MNKKKKKHPKTPRLKPYVYGSSASRAFSLVFVVKSLVLKSFL